MQVAQRWDCARFVMIRRLNVYFCPVDMRELVRNVPQESKTRDNPVRTVGRVCPQHIVSIYNNLYANLQTNT